MLKINNYLAVAIATAISLAAGNAQARTEIQNKGSDTLVNVAQTFAEEYAKVNPEVAIAVSGGGAGTGIAAMSNGTVDIANSMRKLKDQEHKLAASGLGDLFAAVEIVSEKDRGTYDRVFARHGTGADEAVMAGNSMKSDVLPALKAGAFAVHIPYAITWAHELADAPEGHGRFGALDSIADLPAWIAARA